MTVAENRSLSSYTEQAIHELLPVQELNESVASGLVVTDDGGQSDLCTRKNIEGEIE